MKNERLIFFLEAREREREGEGEKKKMKRKAAEKGDRKLAASLCSTRKMSKESKELLQLSISRRKEEEDSLLFPSFTFLTLSVKLKP